MVKVTVESKTNSNSIIFVPEPSGDGILYYLEPGHKMKKLPLSIRKIVELSGGSVESNFVLTGKKETIILAIDPINGYILGSFGGKSLVGHQRNIDSKTCIYLTRSSK